MSESDHEAKVRWQKYTRNSLFLTYAAALIGLQATTLMSKDTIRVEHSCLFIATGIIGLCSLIAGCVVVLVHLRDARLSARIARYRDEGRSKADIETLRHSTDFLGRVTNSFLPLQVALFGIAALVFICWVVVAFSGKLA